MQGSARSPGRIITFYSYKGGTGRSMALANMAWILACNGQRVLVIDWDLEAPGLHRYFRPFLIDEELTSSNGLIDLVDNYANHAIRPVGGDNKPDDDWFRAFADFSDYLLSVNFRHFPEGGGIDLLPAGRQNDTYAVKVSSFNWQNFYDRLGGGGFFEALKENAREAYDYVLIDSRTGVSDTAGICTVQMPDSLAVCFTYNNQSIKGAAATAESAIRVRAKLDLERQQQRRGRASAPSGALADTPAPYVVFPVPMRVDFNESDRLEARQVYARDCFKDMVGHVEPARVSEYWAKVEVPYVAFYAYEEVLAPFKDNPEDPKTVLSSFVRMTAYLTGERINSFRMPIPPKDRQEILDAFARTRATAAKAARPQPEAATELPDAAVLRAAETALAALDKREVVLARRVFCRLVRLLGDNEGGGHIAIRANVQDFDEAQRTVIGKLAGHAVLAVVSDVADQKVALANERLLNLWKPLQEWLAEDREFLLWRQRLRAYLMDWERSGQDRAALLTGTLLAEAQLWKARRQEDLNAAEIRFVEASRAELAAMPMAPAHRRTSAALVLFSVVALFGVVLLTLAFTPTERLQALAAKAGLPARLWSSPAQVKRLVDQARQAEAKQDRDTATALYRKALEMDPEQRDALLGLAALRRVSGEYGEALAIYKKMAQRSPNDIEVLMGLGLTQAALGGSADKPDEGRASVEESLAAFNAVLKLDDKNSDAYYYRGAEYAALDQSAAALADFTMAIRWRQNFPEAYLARAQLHEKAGRKSDAVADYRSVALQGATGEQAKFAQTRIAELTPQQVAVPATRRVFIQYQGAEDEARAGELRRTLGALLKGVALPGIERVSVRSAGDIRYFFADDKEFAQQVKDATEDALAKQGVRASLQLLFRDGTRFDKARPGTVEVWLPSLSGPSQLLRDIQQRK